MRLVRKVLQMSELARIIPAVAVACPNCKARLSELPLDDLAQGASYSCPECGEVLRMPPTVLEKLLAQRAAFAAQFPDPEPALSFWRRLLARVKGWWKRGPS